MLHDAEALALAPAVPALAPAVPALAPAVPALAPAVQALALAVPVLALAVPVLVLAVPVFGVALGVTPTSWLGFVPAALLVIVPPEMPPLGLLLVPDDVALFKNWPIALPLGGLIIITIPFWQCEGALVCEQCM